MGQGQGRTKGLPGQGREGGRGDRSRAHSCGHSRRRELMAGPWQRGARSARGPGGTGRGLWLGGCPPQLTLQVLCDQVGLVMLSEVVTPHEALLTLGALEAFVPWEEKTPVTSMRMCHPTGLRTSARDLTCSHTGSAPSTHQALQAHLASLSLPCSHACPSPLQAWLLHLWS